jgi:hypothetical protein
MSTSFAGAFKVAPVPLQAARPSESVRSSGTRSAAVLRMLLRMWCHPGSLTHVLGWGALQRARVQQKDCRRVVSVSLVRAQTGHLGDHRCGAGERNDHPWRDGATIVWSQDSPCHREFERYTYYSTVIGR